MAAMDGWARETSRTHILIEKVISLTGREVTLHTVKHDTWHGQRWHMTMSNVTFRKAIKSKRGMNARDIHATLYCLFHEIRGLPGIIPSRKACFP